MLLLLPDCMIDPDSCLIVLLEIKMDLAAQYPFPNLQGRKTFSPDGQISGHQLSFGCTVRDASLFLRLSSQGKESVGTCQLQEHPPTWIAKTADRQRSPHH